MRKQEHLSSRTKCEPWVAFTRGDLGCVCVCVCVCVTWGAKVLAEVEPVDGVGGDLSVLLRDA